VAPEEENQPDRPTPSRSLFERTRARAETARSAAERAAARAEAERRRHGTVDAAFEMVDHDSEVGGGIMAGALAYRLFIWLLPFSLVAVAGLGFAAEANAENPEDTAQWMGLAGIVSSSVASSASSSARWYALFIGVPLLVYATRSLLRTLIVTHRLVWTDMRGAVPKPTLPSTLLLLLVLLVYFFVTGLANLARGWSPTGGLLVTLLVPIAYGALWLLVSERLPHRTATRRDLLPGAVLFGLGIEVLQVVGAYFIAPQAESREGTYGSLGVAAALLLGLFLISRLMIGTAVVNSTLVRRRELAAEARTRRAERDRAAASPPHPEGESES
jgi:uncharacterized BrkB/YihY/UPF0761 family membrane protein